MRLGTHTGSCARNLSLFTPTLSSAYRDMGWTRSRGLGNVVDELPVPAAGISPDTMGATSIPNNLS